MKIELIEGSETSAIRTQTPGNYPKVNILQDYTIYICTNNTIVKEKYEFKINISTEAATYNVIKEILKLRLIDFQ